MGPETSGQQDPVCKTKHEDWSGALCLHDFIMYSARMRTQGSKDNKVHKRATGQWRARDVTFSQHGHIGMGSERVLEEVGPYQARQGPSFPGGGGPEGGVRS